MSPVCAHRAANNAIVASKGTESGKPIVNAFKERGSIAAACLKNLG
jgi:hypothetical protein